jgi:hypothetical protein
MTEAGAIKGRGMLLEVLRIRSGVSRDRLHFAAPHKDMVVDATVTYVGTNSSVPVVDAPPPLPGMLEMEVDGYT